MRRHPQAAELALFAGGELPVWRRAAVWWHAGHCPECAKELAALGQMRAWMKLRVQELPPEVDWAALEAEMRANIRLGLAAGALVGDRRGDAAAPGWEWRSMGVVAASLAFVAIAVWILERPRPEVPAGRAAAAAELVLDASQGLAVRGRGEDVAVFGPQARPVSAAVNWDGSARVRFVDAETGQVTIYNVAAQ